MGNFEKLVLKMRQSQEKYRQTKSKADYLTMVLNEDEVDDYLDFLQVDNLTSYSSVKKYLKRGCLNEE